jgi:hypothetical protein
MELKAISYNRAYPSATRGTVKVTEVLFFEGDFKTGETKATGFTRPMGTRSKMSPYEARVLWDERCPGFGALLGRVFTDLKGITYRAAKKVHVDVKASVATKELVFCDQLDDGCFECRVGSELAHNQVFLSHTNFPTMQAATLCAPRFHAWTWRRGSMAGHHVLTCLHFRELEELILKETSEYLLDQTSQPCFGNWPRPVESYYGGLSLFGKRVLMAWCGMDLRGTKPRAIYDGPTRALIKMGMTFYCEYYAFKRATELDDSGLAGFAGTTCRGAVAGDPFRVKL